VSGLHRPDRGGGGDLFFLVLSLVFLFQERASKPFPVGAENPMKVV